MSIFKLLIIAWLLTTSLQLQAKQDDLQKLIQQLNAEQKQSEQWLKALNRVQQRNQKRVKAIDKNTSFEAKEQLLAIQADMQKKQQLLARYRTQLANTQQQIPAWLSLIAANQVNQEMQLKINDAELLLESAQKLETQDWLMRTPEELWRDLELKR